MGRWKRFAIVVALLAAYGFPALAEANGEGHVHVGDLHFDPWVGGAVAIFVGLITLMFVGQWIRFNAARRSAGGLEAEDLPEKGEATNDNGQKTRGEREP